MAKRLPASVYRRRRIVALVAAVIVIALVWWAIAALVGGDSNSSAAEPTTTATPTTTAAVPVPATTAPAPTETAVAEQTPTPAPAACTDATVTVEAVADAESYADEVQPQLAMRVTNVGNAACAIDVGTATQVYTITSGDDTVWVSTHCQQNPTTEVVALQPGQQLDAPAIGWVREWSSPDTCEQERPAADGGGSTYDVTASIGGITSGPATFVLE